MNRWNVCIAVVLMVSCVGFSAAPSKSQHVRVFKKARRLEVLSPTGKVIREYRVALGDDPVGTKVCEGDEKTPEGNYKLDFINEKSRFYRSIHVNYPLAKDKEAAKRKGCSPGGDIFLHGTGSLNIGRAHQLVDWTDGCVAVSNAEIDEIISLLKLPARIEINP